MQSTSATRARKFFEAGRGADDVGSYREALNYFQQSYELSGRSALLYNVGQCADRLRMDEAALDAFKRDLDLRVGARKRGGGGAAHLRLGVAELQRLDEPVPRSARAASQLHLEPRFRTRVERSAEQRAQHHPQRQLTAEQPDGQPQRQRQRQLT